MKERSGLRRTLLTLCGLLLLANLLGLIWLMPHMRIQEMEKVRRHMGASAVEDSREAGALFSLSQGLVAGAQQEILSDAVIIALPEGDPGELQETKNKEGSAGIRDRVVLGFDSRDTTGHRDVRSQAYKVGVGYKVSDNSVLGLEAQKELHDSNDARNSETPEERDVMQVRYKLKF